MAFPEKRNQLFPDSLRAQIYQKFLPHLSLEDCMKIAESLKEFRAKDWEHCIKGNVLLRALLHFDKSLDEIRLVPICDNGLMALTSETDWIHTPTDLSTNVQAKTLRRILLEHGIEMSVRKCLEMLAQMANYKNWGVYSAKLKAADRARPSFDFPLIDHYEKAPALLFSWEGHMLDAGTIEGSDDVLSYVLDDKYPGDEMPGDPRNFISGSGHSYVVQHQGKVGVMTEVELAYILVDSTEGLELDENGFDDEGCIPLEKNAFMAAVSLVRAQMEQFFIANGHLYPETQYFAVYGDAGYTMDRLSVCAYTPLKETAPFTYAAPYEDIKALDKLDSDVWDTIVR